MHSRCLLVVYVCIRWLPHFANSIRHAFHISPGPFAASHIPPPPPPPRRNTHVAYYYVIIKFCATEFEWNVRDSPRPLLSMPDRPFLNDFSNFVWSKIRLLIKIYTFIVKKKIRYNFYLIIKYLWLHSVEFFKRRNIDDKNVAVIIHILLHD